MPLQSIDGGVPYLGFDSRTSARRSQALALLNRLESPDGQKATGGNEDRRKLVHVAMQQITNRCPPPPPSPAAMWTLSPQRPYRGSPLRKTLRWVCIGFQTGCWVAVLPHHRAEGFPAAREGSYGGRKGGSLCWSPLARERVPISLGDGGFCANSAGFRGSVPLLLHGAR